MTATKMFFIWMGKGVPPICFEYRTASEQIRLSEILEKQYRISNSEMSFLSTWRAGLCLQMAWDTIKRMEIIKICF